MLDQRQFVPRIAAVFLACGLIVGLLSSRAAAQDHPAAR